ncbi:hypothetical protein BD410DRAFT_787649 [Rickenella mellea]|uniref:Uncharacterized protein n=1 Tax=Rickenella mellea TaxID=50990 RepID=A0A4Y7Q7Y0_9AGAM|nr:hypothetical protein BD410DRAFT_787649 [Rickenella mellea]
MDYEGNSDKDDWTRKMERWATNLNSAPARQVFEVGCSVDRTTGETADNVQVGPAGTILAGDIEQSMGEDDVFEVVIEDVKPGIWSYSELSETIAEGENTHEMRSVYFHWTSYDPLDYDAPPSNRRSGRDRRVPNYDLEWRQLGEFSIESGDMGVFSEEGLAMLLASNDEVDREYVFETLIELSFSHGPAVPGGIISKSVPRLTSRIFVDEVASSWAERRV